MDKTRGLLMSKKTPILVGAAALLFLYQIYQNPIVEVLYDVADICRRTMDTFIFI